MTAQPKHDDGWEMYGSVYDRQATLATIQALQGEGKQVRVVREGNRNVVYTKDRAAS